MLFLASSASQRPRGNLSLNLAEAYPASTTSLYASWNLPLYRVRRIFSSLPGVCELLSDALTGAVVATVASSLQLITGHHNPISPNSLLGLNRHSTCSSVQQICIATMSWNLTKSIKPTNIAVRERSADSYEEFKDTHLGPLKNPLSGRSTSTSTIKPDASEPMDEKMSVASGTNNGIGTSKTSQRCGQSSLWRRSCVRGHDISPLCAHSARDSYCHPP